MLRVLFANRVLSLQDGLQHALQSHQLFCPPGQLNKSQPIKGTLRNPRGTKRNPQPIKGDPRVTYGSKTVTQPIKGNSGGTKRRP